MILKIIGGIILLIIILLLGSCAVYIEYDNNITVKIKYLFFTVFKYPVPPKKTKKTKKTGKDKKPTPPPPTKETPPVREDIPNTVGENKEGDAPKTSSSPQQKKGKKPSLISSVKETLNSDLLESIQLFVSSAKAPLLKLIKSIRIQNLEIYILAVGEDAAKAALNYGKFSAMVGGFIGWLDSIMTVQVKSLDIAVDFQKETGVYQGKGVIKLRLFTALVCVSAFFINIFKQTYNKGKIGGSKNGRTSNSRSNEYSNGKNKGTG